MPRPRDSAVRAGATELNLNPDLLRPPILSGKMLPKFIHARFIFGLH
jgi:hypothetical protein